MDFGNVLERLGLNVVAPANRAEAVAIRERQTERVEARWHDACLVGRCRYRDADPRERDPKAITDAVNYCGGYHGAHYVETDGSTTWRWRPCARQMAWWRRRQAYLAGEAATQRDRKRGMPKEYEA